MDCIGGLMPNFRRFPMAIVVILFFTGSLYGQLWSGIIDPSRAVNWANAGVPGGIPARATICSTLGVAGQPPAYNQSVTAAQITIAIAGCPSGETVFLNTGTYHLTCYDTCIEFMRGSTPVSNVTLRGAGADQTLIILSGSGDRCSGAPKSIVCMLSSDISYPGGPANTAAWTASSYAAGTTSLIFTNARNLKVGATPVILDQLDNLNDTGNVYVGCELPPTSGYNAKCYSGSYPAGAQRGEGAYNTIRGQQQIVTVTACSPYCPNTGTTKVTISPGLYAPNWSSSRSPGAWWASSTPTMDGVENLSLDDTVSTAVSTVGIVNCRGCWVKGIRSINPGRSHVWIWTSNHVTVQDSYFYGDQRYASESYGIETFGASDLLIQNNIMQRTANPVMINSDCEGCVVGHNYSINDKYSKSPYWLSASLGFHSTNMFILAEGNIGAGLYADSFHGNHNFDTIFRSRYDGYESNDGTLAVSNTVPLRANPFTRYMNFIGNVLGSTRRHTLYQCATPACNNYASIYWLGVYQEVQAPFDPLVGSTLFRWGNYDTVTNAVRWCGNSSDPGWSTACRSTSEVPTGLSVYANAVPSSTVLPASFYLSSKPAWWPSGKPWPAIGPDVTGGNIGICSGGIYSSQQSLSRAGCPGGTYTPAVGGHAYSNPAMDCYVNTMGGPTDGAGGVLKFNASACYSSSKGLHSPVKLKAVVH
jgi:hypothetical protein